MSVFHGYRVYAVRGKLGANTFGPAAAPAEASGTPLVLTVEVEGWVCPTAQPDTNKFVMPKDKTITLRAELAGK